MRKRMTTLSDEQARRLTAGLGLALLAFGALPAVAPKPFAWLFGLDLPTPATASMIRSIGVRDAVMGVGLWSAATHGGNYAPWLLARILSDGGDTVAVGIAAAQGQRQPRFLGLGALAFAATLADSALWLLARHPQE